MDAEWTFAIAIAVSAGHLQHNWTRTFVLFGDVTATDVIATIALAISFASAVAAAISLYLAFRESDRRDEEIRLLRAEAGRRDEELQLLRHQVVAEQEERRRYQQAHISVGDRVRGESVPGRGIEYTASLQNTGVYIASEISVELVDPSGERVGVADVERALVPGERADVMVMTPPPGRYTGPYEIFAKWNDGRGTNREATGVRVGAP